MQPSLAKVPGCCAQRTQLAKEYAIAVRIYSDAVVDLTRNASEPLSKDSYERLRKKVHETHGYIDDAVMAFEEHVASHHCLD
jgi:hypothetical protein